MCHRLAYSDILTSVTSFCQQSSVLLPSEAAMLYLRRLDGGDIDQEDYFYSRKCPLNGFTTDRLKYQCLYSDIMSANND